jgi:hypothetical protein
MVSSLFARLCGGGRRSTKPRPPRLNRTSTFWVPPALSSTSRTGPSPSPAESIQRSTAAMSTASAITGRHR